MRSFWKYIDDGFRSIRDGFVSIARAPFIHDIEPVEETFERLDIPKTDEEAFERDRKKLESDRKKVLGEE